MAHQMASRLARDGHDVTVICPFPNRPGGRLYPGFKRHLRRVEATGDGYKRVRCANWLLGKHRHPINRLLENITFGLSAAWAAWREGRPDLFLVETWPLFAVTFTAVLAHCWRVPFLYYVKDIYPEAAERTGLIRSDSLVARFCRLWDRYLCQSSAQVIVISDSMRKLLTHGRKLRETQFTVIPDWQDANDFPPQPIESAWRREHGIPADAFVAMYGGTLGKVSGAEVLLEVAKLLRDRHDILVICLGEGLLKQGMIDQCRSLGFDNIRFLPFQPRARLGEVQSSANVTLLTMRPGYPDASVPSKLISYFAAGRPVISAVPKRSAVGEIVLESGGGVVTNPGDARALALALRALAASPGDALRMGRAARAYFEKHFTLDRAHRQFTDLLKRAADSTGASPAFKCDIDVDDQHSAEPLQSIGTLNCERVWQEGSSQRS